MSFDPREHYLKKALLKCLAYSSIFTLSIGVMILAKNASGLLSRLANHTSILAAFVSVPILSINGVYFLASKIDPNFNPPLPPPQVQQAQPVMPTLDILTTLIHPDFNVQPIINYFKGYFKSKPVASYYPAPTDEQITQGLDKIIALNR